jgi:hypothetical protein
MIVLLALGTLSQSRWWLLPLAVTYALLAMECAELYERRRALPEVLASRAVSDPIDGVFVMPEPEVVRSLVVLANNDWVMVQRARCLLERAGQHRHGCRRLVQAERLLAQRAGSSPSELPRRHP